MNDRTDMEHDTTIEAIELAALEPGGLDRLMAGDTETSRAVAAHLAGCESCSAALVAVHRDALVIARCRGDDPARPTCGPGRWPRSAAPGVPRGTDGALRRILARSARRRCWRRRRPPALRPAVAVTRSAASGTPTGRRPGLGRLDRGDRAPLGRPDGLRRRGSQRRPSSRRRPRRSPASSRSPPPRWPSPRSRMRRASR